MVYIICRVYTFSADLQIGEDWFGMFAIGGLQLTVVLSQCKLPTATCSGQLNFRLNTSDVKA